MAKPPIINLYEQQEKEKADRMVNTAAQDLIRRLHGQGNPSVNGITPKPNDITETTSPTPQPKMSDFNWHQDFMKQYLDKPISAEEQAKRARAASTIEGIGNLGNVMNAFANLVYVGKGAPNQAPQVAPKSELDKFEDRVKDQRMKYASSMMAARNADKSEYQNEWERWNAKRNEDIANERYNKEWQYKVGRDAVADERYEKQQAQAQANADRAYELQKKAQEQSNALRWAELNARQDGSYFDNNGSAYKDTISLPDGRYLQLDREKIGKTMSSKELKDLYALVPDEIKGVYPLNRKKESENVDNVYNAIFAASQSSPDFVQRILNKKLGKYIDSEEGESSVIDYVPNSEEIIEYVPNK